MGLAPHNLLVTLADGSTWGGWWDHESGDQIHVTLPIDPALPSRDLEGWFGCCEELAPQVIAWLATRGFRAAIVTVLP